MFATDLKKLYTVISLQASKSKFTITLSNFKVRYIGCGVTHSYSCLQWGSFSAGSFLFMGKIITLGSFFLKKSSYCTAKGRGCNFSTAVIILLYADPLLLPHDCGISISFDISEYNFIHNFA